IDIATSVYDNGMNTLINNSAPPSFASVDTLVYTDTLVIDTLHYSGISYHTSYDTVPPYLIHEVDTLKEIYTYMVDSIKTYTLIIRKGNLCSGPFTDTLVSEVGIKRSYLSSTDTLYLGKHFDSTLVSIIVPNVFSPNGDGVNDYFFIKASGFEFAGYTIFNRWGKVMFETDVWNDGWDGKYNEKDVPEGTYYYIVRGKDVIGGKKEIKGYLLLVR
ncbi:MAG: gliding motility-associated C-terminal domain-containing protein, partial [Bacteroidia bacterium]